METYAALRLGLESWRWAGVPFFLRSGKRLKHAVTEVRVTLKAPPQSVFSGRSFAAAAPNHLRFRLSPQVEIALGASVLAGDGRAALEAVELFACRDASRQGDPYELLLGAALAGDPLLFARRDEVEEAWRIVDPVIADAPALQPYAPGSWGPQAAATLTGAAGWSDPAP